MATENENMVASSDFESPNSDEKDALFSERREEFRVEVVKVDTETILLQESVY